MKINILLIIIFALVTGCKFIQNLHPEFVKKGEESPMSEECRECHIDIYDEWSNSMHSKSYTSNAFKDSTNDYEFDFCLGCHVPETIFAQKKNITEENPNNSLIELSGKEIKPRDYKLEEGVNCHSCHLTIDCKLAGPHSGIAPHPIEQKAELYLKSGLCGICHVDTYKEYQMHTDNEKTCQDCHMRSVKRKLIQDEPWQKLHRRKDGKAHTFSRIDAKESNDKFIVLSFKDIVKENNQIKGIVEIENTMVSHSIPTGRYGYREVLLLINLKNNLGGIIQSKQESLFIEMETQLKPKEKRAYPFSFNVNDEARELEAVLLKTDFNRINKTILAKMDMEI